MRVVLVHGFNVHDYGARSVDMLAPGLFECGYVVDKDEADYGWFGLLGVRFRKANAIERIACAIRKADAVITHSNGANFAHKAIELTEQNNEFKRGQRPLYVVHVSPALNRDAELPKSVTRCLVLHNKKDMAVQVARFLLFHPWGDMGAHGPTSPDPRYDSEDCSDFIKGHSAWFHGFAATWTASMCCDWLKQNGHDNGKATAHNPADRLPPD